MGLRSWTSDKPDAMGAGSSTLADRWPREPTGGPLDVSEDPVPPFTMQGLQGLSENVFVVYGSVPGSASGQSLQLKAPRSAHRTRLAPDAYRRERQPHPR